MEKETAIKILKELHDKSLFAERTALETIIPELKESWDERIRKELIFYLGDMPEDTELRNGVTNRDVLVWLEKQKSVRETVERCKNSWYNEGKIDGMAEGLTNDERYQQGWHDALEKQGEKQPILAFNANDWYVSKVDGKIHNIYHSVDKIEPKFKVGDWVVDEHWHTHIVKKVSKIDEDGYSFNNGDFASFECANEYFHLWTIKDAKDGDVLVDICDDFVNPLIFILKKFERKDFGLAKLSDYSSYCYLTMSDNQKFKEGSYHHMHNIHPATKEQCDLLFSKMKEAGYEWDAEKKELKKLTQSVTKKSDQDVWSDEDDAYIVNWLKSLKRRLSMVKNC